MSAQDKEQLVNYGTAKTLEIGGSLLFALDEETGILSLSANEKSCRSLSYMAGLDGSGTPRNVTLVTDELPGQPPFFYLYDVREIVPLPRKEDGTYWFAFGSGHDED